MKRNIIHKLTAPMMIAAGILIGVPDALLAQNQSQSKPKSNTQQTQSHTKHGANTNTAKGNNAANKNKSMVSNSDEAMFVRKASEANLAEIKLGELAMEKGSTNEIREYGQMMVKDHTMAQTQLAQIVSNYSAANKKGYMNDDANDSGDANKMASTGATGGTSGNSMAHGKTNGEYNSNSPVEKKDNADVVGEKNAKNPSGGTTATGSTYASGNGNGAPVTANKTQGRSNDGAASNNSNMSSKPGEVSGNNANANSTTNPGLSPTRTGRGELTEPNNTVPAGADDARTSSDGTGGGGAGANSGGTTSSTSSGRVGRANADSQARNDNQGQGNTAQGDMRAEDNNTNFITNSMSYDLPTELSPEHKALRDRLAKLSGAEFDREYMQAMVKDHAKTVALFEKQSMADNAKDMPKDDQLKQFATNMLPILKKHHEKAEMLLGGSKTGNSPAKEHKK
jgi:putative membrane protein